MKEIGSIFPLYEKTASPPALAHTPMLSTSDFPRREGADSLTEHPIENILQTPLNTPAPSLRGRAGGEAAFLSSCREAIYLIAKKEMANGKKAMLPKYTGSSVIAPFQQLEYDYQFYPVCKDLTIDIPKAKEIFSVHHPNLIVVHPYFGMDLTKQEQDMLEEMHESGCETILDLTQCLFSTMRLPFIKYYIGSIRKWFAIPDGAFLETNEEMQTPSIGNDEIVALQTKAMQLRGNYFLSGDAKVKDESIRLSHEVESLMTRPITPHAMASVSKELLALEDADAQQKIRIENYKCLYEGLKDVKDIELIADISRLTTAPLFFPFRVSNISEMQRKLAQKSIYARLIWEKEDRILTISVDQRYDLSDMDRVIAAIKKRD